MWTATIDFTKAFDSIIHKSIWKAFKSCGIEHDYISLDEESNMFEIKKGTKQGDPLSSLLFNMVLHTESTGRRHPALAKEKGNGNLLE